MVWLIYWSNGYSYYKAITSQELTEENNPLFNVNDTEIAYSEKLRAIQNDILAAYYDKTISVSQAEVLLGDTIQPEAPPKDEFQLQPTTLDFSSKVPVFIRILRQILFHHPVMV